MLLSFPGSREGFQLCLQQGWIQPGDLHLCWEAPASGPPAAAVGDSGCAAQPGSTSRPSRQGAEVSSRARGSCCSSPPPAKGTPWHTAWARGERARHSSSGDFAQQCVFGSLSQTGVCLSKRELGSEAPLCPAVMPRENYPTSSTHVSTSKRTPPCHASLLLRAPAGAAMAPLLCQHRGFPFNVPSSALLSPPAHTVAVSQPHGPALRRLFWHLNMQR